MINEILIHPTPRGYTVTLPYCPSDTVKRALHSIGMTWRKNVGDVSWSIPAERLAESINFLVYWYGEKMPAGKVAYGVRVVESESLQEAA
jgi:hypothetical protein